MHIYLCFSFSNKDNGELGKMTICSLKGLATMLGGEFPSKIKNVKDVKVYEARSIDGKCN